MSSSANSFDECFAEDSDEKRKYGAVEYFQRQMARYNEWEKQQGSDYDWTRDVFDWDQKRKRKQRRRKRRERRRHVKAEADVAALHPMKHEVAADPAWTNYRHKMPRSDESDTPDVKPTPLNFYAERPDSQVLGQTVVKIKRSKLNDGPILISSDENETKSGGCSGDLVTPALNGGSLTGEAQIGDQQNRKRNKTKKGKSRIVIDISDEEQADGEASDAELRLGDSATIGVRSHGGCSEAAIKEEPGGPTKTPSEHGPTASVVWSSKIGDECRTKRDIVPGAGRTRSLRERSAQPQVDVVIVSSEDEDCGPGAAKRRRVHSDVA